MKTLAGLGLSVTVIGESAEQLQGHIPLHPKINWVQVSRSSREIWRMFLDWTIPVAGLKSNTRSFRSRIREMLNDKWDIVVVDHVGMGWALPLLKNSQAKLVYFSHNHEEQVSWDLARSFSPINLKKIALFENYRRVRRLERRLLKRSHIVSTICPEDMRAMMKLAISPRYLVVLPGYSGERRLTRTLDRSTPREVIMIGSFDWLPKQLNLLKFVKSAELLFSKARIKLNIVGRVPAHVQDQIRKTSPSTEVHGFLEDVRPLYDRSRIAVIFEETGGGFKLKQLDYAFNRVPIFALSASIAGSPKELKTLIETAETMEELALKIVDQIENFGKLNDLQNRLFDQCEHLFDWRTNTGVLAEALSGK